MSFYYNVCGDDMKIYVDLVLFLNFGFDFLLLLTVSLLLKRNIKFKRIILGAIIGSLSTFLLFFSISSFTLFLFKFLISILMIVVTFNFKNIRYTLKNFLHLYIVSILLGGFLYMLNIEFSYKQVGLVFYHNGLSINFIILIIFSPIILYIYYKELTKLKVNRNFTYKVNLYYKDKIYNLNAYLDTGNKLVSPYSNKPIIILNKNIIDIQEFFYLNLHTISGNDLMKCIKANKIDIENIGIRKNVIVGISNDYLKLDGIDLLLNSKLLEE